METPTHTAPPVDLDSLDRLSSDWRELADLCDSEIERTKTEPPTLIMSDDEKARYEQAARTYRFCADALDSKPNVVITDPHRKRAQPTQKGK